MCRWIPPWHPPVAWLSEKLFQLVPLLPTHHVAPYAVCVQGKESPRLPLRELAVSPHLERGRLGVRGLCGEKERYGGGQPQEQPHHSLAPAVGKGWN